MLYCLNLGFASDHRGYKLKSELISYYQKNGYHIIDYGTNSTISCDYPDYAYKLGNALLKKEVDFGVAICGSGIGISIALNKMKGIYCAKVSTPSEARLCKSHNNANVIAISEELPEEIIIEIVNNFIVTPFSNVNKYIRRNDMIKEMEND